MLNPFEVFEISEHRITATVDCHIQIKLDKEHPALETADIIEVSGVMNFVVPSADKGLTLTYPYPVLLNKTGEGVSIDIINGVLNIEYKSGAVVLEQEQVEDKTDVKTIKSLLTGQAKNITNPLTLVRLISNQIKGTDMSHIELIVATLYRIGKDPARYSGKYGDALIVNPVTKTINDSWLSAIAFRDINKGIANGLVGGENISMNPIEKVINQDFASL